MTTPSPAAEPPWCVPTTRSCARSSRRRSPGKCDLGDVVEEEMNGTTQPTSGLEADIVVHHPVPEGQVVVIQQSPHDTTDGDRTPLTCYRFRRRPAGRAGRSGPFSDAKITHRQSTTSHGLRLAKGKKSDTLVSADLHRSPGRHLPTWDPRRLSAGRPNQDHRFLRRAAPPHVATSRIPPDRVDQPRIHLALVRSRNPCSGLASSRVRRACRSS